MGKCKGCEQEVKKLVKDRCIECYPVDIGRCESEVIPTQYMVYQDLPYGWIQGGISAMPMQYMVYQLGFEYLFEDDKHD